MKVKHIALAMLVAAPMVANAGVTVTPLFGYHEGALTNKDNQMNALGDNLGRGGYSALSLGYEVTPSMGVEIEYGQANDTVKHPVANVSNTSGRWDYREQMMTGNIYVTSDMMTNDYAGAFKPYVLVGAGQSKISSKSPFGTTNTNGTAAVKQISSTDTIANIGLGSFFRMNDALALRTELRAVHNFDHNWWEGMALAGLQVVLGGHNMPYVPAPAPVEPPPAPEPVIVQPVVVTPPPAPAPIDSDGDGVTDDIDQCPNTPRGVAVDARGCPQQITEDLKMELRVFFDINKSKIKAQYKPEIAKVADKLREYPNAVAHIEGHTDNTGPRRLNERLSLARANAVKSMLASEFSVDPSRITTQGFAWDRPIASNKTKEGRAMNRRVYAIINGSRTVPQTR